VLGHGGETLDVTEGTTRLVAAHDRGTHLGRADIDVGEQATVVATRLVRVEAKTEAEPTIAAAVKTYVAETKRRLDAKLATLSTVQPPPKPPPKVWTQPEETWTYGSNAACNLCHPPVMDQWKTTAHAYALQTLEMQGRQRDPYCLGCHATGFLQAGGTRNLETALTYFTDVGCESCHGPSVEHVRSQKKAGTVRKMPELVCRGCHRPDQQAEPFDYKEAVARILGPAHGRK
jgi:Cytochrome c554 and c-prime